MKTLVIAEKPSVARDIGKVLKCSQKSEGYIFNEEYIVSWAIGHLVTLFQPEDYHEDLKKWDFDSLPIIPKDIKLKPINSTKKQFKILKKLMNSREVGEIICATDSGREGELIFRYIYSLANCTKQFSRLWISSMTDEAIKDGFANLKSGLEYDNLYYSAKCRSEADWLVGINGSRAFTLKFKNLLSIGRVQTPTLAILVERQKEINAFVPQDYFEIEAKFQTIGQEVYTGIYIDKKNETKIPKKEAAQEIIKICKDEDGQVFSIETERKKQIPPLLYDLTELQRECNRKFGYSAQKTLSIAQDLYEKRKMITYPRTDSRYLPSDMRQKLRGILNKIAKNEYYIGFCEPLLEGSLRPTRKIIDDSKVSDHYAIIPTNAAPKTSSLSQDEFNVYDLIVRRFISVFYEEYIYDVTKITTKILEYNFLTKGNIVIQKGWTALNKTSEKDSSEENILPNVKEEEKVYIEKLKILAKKTKPPKNYTDATLLSAMENAGRFVEDEEIKEKLKESGLGTPATRASIIERLIKIGYITRKARSILPTEKGMKLIEIVPDQLKSPETTGKWEKALTSISKGHMTYDTFMGSINRYVDFIVDFAGNAKDEIVFEQEKTKKYSGKKPAQITDCPVCDGKIFENSKSFYCSNWKSGCKFSVWKNSVLNWDFEINEKNVKILIEQKSLPIVKLKHPETKQAIIGDIVFFDLKAGKLSVKNIQNIDD